MPGRSIKIARIAGIPVGISPWWLAIVALITWTLGDAYFPEVISGVSPAVSYTLGFASALLLFASILAHEFGHAIVARRHGIEIEEIDLWLLGGVSKMRGEAKRPGDELRYAIAGPAVTAAVAAIFGVLALLLPSSTPEVITALIDYQLLVNVLILIFNLMPAFPLDGGRVLRSLLWRRSGDMERATSTAAATGKVFGYIIIGLGILETASGAPQGLWLALIGVFIVVAAGAQATSSKMQAALSGVSAAQLMSSPAVSIDSRLSVREAVNGWFLPYRYTAFPVIDEHGRALGLIALATVEGLSEQERERMSVSEAADVDETLLSSGDVDVATLVSRPAFARLGRLIVIDEQGRPLGLLSITDVQRTLRASVLRGRERGANGASGEGGGDGARDGATRRHLPIGHR